MWRVLFNGLELETGVLGVRVHYGLMDHGVTLTWLGGWLWGEHVTGGGVCGGEGADPHPSNRQGAGDVLVSVCHLHCWRWGGCGGCRGGFLLVPWRQHAGGRRGGGVGEIELPALVRSDVNSLVYFFDVVGNVAWSVEALTTVRTLVRGLASVFAPVVL